MPLILRKLRFVNYLALVLLALPAGCKRAAPPAEETAPPSVVKWEGASSVALEEWTELVGTTQPLPDRIARVSSPVEGRVQRVFGDETKPVAEGDRVEKGAVLVQLDPTLVQANLAKAEATQEALKEEQKQAQLAYELATHELDRLHQLQEEERKRGGGVVLVPPADLQRAQFALKDAESKLAGARNRLTAGAREQEGLRAQLRLLTLTAPIAGRLGRLQVAPGQTLSVGTMVADIVDLDEQIEVLSFVPPSLIRKLELHQPALSGPVEKDPNVSEPEAEGEVVFIAQQAEPETGNFAVKVRFNNKDAHLRANRVLRIRVQTHPTEERLSLPLTAVNEDEEIPTVVIAENIHTETNADGKEETVATARKLQAVLGLRDRSKRQVEIVSLQDPDTEAKTKWQGEVKDQKFIVEGLQGLQTSDKVKLEVEGD